MRNKKKQCNHVLTNGEVCNAIPMRDSNFCYWHHKARARHRRYERIGGPITMEANSGLELPFLEDANAIQVSIQEIMQAIHIRNLTPLPTDTASYIDRIGSNDDKPFDCIGSDDREEFCDENCSVCAEPACDHRTKGVATGAATNAASNAATGATKDSTAKVPPATGRAN
jgi:hypothetical protein